jgi:isoquinoline 1-oxidoreductase beta subunit
MADGISEVARAGITIGRRGFLIGSLSSGVVTVGYGALPAWGAEPVSTGLYSPSLWYDIDDRGIVTVNIAKAEMGQHVGTPLAQAVAEELGADWSQMRIRHVDSDPKWGTMITGGSWSVNWTFDLLSRAGAAGRIALVAAAAKQFGVAPEACVAASGKVTSGGKSVTYAELVKAGGIAAAMSDADLKAIKLKAPAQYKIVGKNVAALDIPAKTDGSARYGIDFQTPNMVFGKLVRPPARNGATVKTIDDQGARKIPGYIKTLSLDDPSKTFTGLVVVIADNYWAAWRAADAVQVEWDAGPHAKVDDAALLAAARQAAADPNAGAGWVIDGDADAALAKASGVVAAEYLTGANLHAPMEPVNATAMFDNGIWHLHAGNQFQTAAVPLAAKALGVDPAQVVLHQYYLGGGFGRRLYGDYLVPAALAAKAMGRPVKLVYNRTDDMRLDCPRSPSFQALRAVIGSDGRVSALTHDVVAGWPTDTVAPALLADTPDKRKADSFAVSGADFWYSVPNHHVRAIRNELAQAALSPGYLRSVGPGFTIWAVESFFDELAKSANADPVAFRLKHLDAAGKQAGGQTPGNQGGAHRLVAVLKAAADRAGWKKKTLPAGTAQGVAISMGQERGMPTFTACVAEVAVDKATGKFTVKKLTVVSDVGTPVNPDGVRAQMESATLWGLSLAIHETGTIKDGAITAGNYDAYTPLRMSQVPELDISFTGAGSYPVGIGEPPTTVVAPAIANAIATAIGARVRSLPITPEKVKAALI